MGPQAVAITLRVKGQGGALKPNGMPPSPQIKDADLEAIRHYLRLRAMQLPSERAALRSGGTAKTGNSPRVAS